MSTDKGSPNNDPIRPEERDMVEKAYARTSKARTDGAIATSRKNANSQGQRREPVVGCAARNESKTPNARDRGGKPPGAGPHG